MFGFFNIDTNIMRYTLVCLLVLVGFVLQAQQQLQIAPKDKAVYPTLIINQGSIKAAKVSTKVGYKMASFTFKEKELERITTPDMFAVDPNGNDYYQGVTQTYKTTLGNTVKIRYAYSRQNDTTFSVFVTAADTGINRLGVTVQCGSTDAFWGVGEQFTHFNLKGKKPEVWVEEQGIGRGDKPITAYSKLVGASGNEYTTYMPMPFFVASTGYSVRILNKGMVKLDFTPENAFAIEAWNDTLQFTITYAKKPLDLVASYAKNHSGTMHPLPNWAYGTIMGLQGGSKRVEMLVDEAIAFNNPVKAVWIQDWVGRRKTRVGTQLFWNWYPDENLYPDFKNWVGKMNAKGVKVLGYINPFLATDSKLLPEAQAKGYLIKDLQGNDYKLQTAGFPAYMVDLTNPKAFEWLKGIVKTNLIGNGLSGWMADFSEWLPIECKNYANINPYVAHNMYPVLWAKLNREAIDESGQGKDIVFFMRAGYEGSARYSPVFWMGDQMPDFGLNDGYESTFTALNSGSLSGLLLNHSDIGGYTTTNLPGAKIHRSPEVLKRWALMNVFQPFFRTHEGLQPGNNYQVYTDTAAIKQFAFAGRLHYALQPYLEYLVNQANTLGYPVNRALCLNYPDDKNTYNQKHSFMLGDALLVCPLWDYEQRANRIAGATVSKVTAVNMYFPPGEWVNVFALSEDERVVTGGTTTKVYLQPNYPPVFIKKDHPWEERLFKALSSVSE